MNVMQSTTSNGWGRRALVLAVGLLTACSAGGTYQGRLTDGKTGQPRADVKLYAKATEGVDMTCQVLQTTSGADGSFKFDKTCADHQYKISTDDKTMALEGDRAFAGGDANPDTHDFKVWRAPSGMGVSIIKDDALSAVSTGSDIDKVGVIGSDMVIEFPSVIPKKPAQVPAGADLVIAGDALIGSMKFRLLVTHSGTIRFPKEDKSYTDLTDAVLVGVRISVPALKGPADVEKVDATVDASKFHDLKVDDLSVRFIPSEAVAPGVYALYGDGDRRMMILEFGGAAEAPAAPAEGAAAEGGAEAAPAGE